MWGGARGGGNPKPRWSAIPPHPVPPPQGGRGRWASAALQLRRRGLRSHPCLDLRPRQYAVSGRLPAVHPGRSEDGRVHRPLSRRAVRLRPASAEELLPPVRHDADGSHEGPQDGPQGVPRLRARPGFVGPNGASAAGGGDRAAAGSQAHLHQRLACACRARRRQARPAAAVRGHLRHRRRRLRAEADAGLLRSLSQGAWRRSSAGGDVRGHAAQSGGPARARHDHGSDPLRRE